MLQPAVYGGYKDASEAWATGVLAVGDEPAATSAMPEELREAWEERVAIMTADGHLPHADAERLAWEGLRVQQAVP